jgi:hypothetical protein
MNLEGKTIKTVRKIPTIETALQASQDVEEFIMEFTDGSVFSISVAELPVNRDPDTDHLKIKVKEGKPQEPEPETFISDCTTKKRRGILGWRFSKS